MGASLLPPRFDLCAGDWLSRCIQMQTGQPCLAVGNTHFQTVEVRPEGRRHTHTHTPKASNDEVCKAAVLHVACLPGLKTYNINPNVKHPYLILRSRRMNLISCTRCVAIFLFFSGHKIQAGPVATGILPIWSRCPPSTQPLGDRMNLGGGAEEKKKKRGNLRDITHFSLPTFIKNVYE